MLIKNLRIVPVNGNTIDCGWIRFDEKIQAVGDMKNCPSEEGMVFDPGFCAYPGFVDAHSHLGLIGDAQDIDCEDCNESTGPSTPQMRALDGLNPFDPCWDEALKAGITTVCVTPGSANPIAGMACIVKTYGHGLPPARIIAQTNALKVALGENPKRIYGKRDIMPASRMGIAALIRQKFVQAQEYLNKRLDKKNPAFDPELDVLANVLENKLPLHIHAHRADDMLTAMRLAEEFELPHLIVHGTQGYLISETLAEKGTAVLCGPLLACRCKPELSGATPANPGILSKAGVTVAIVTDHPEIPSQYLPLTAGLAVREGMTRDRALRAITLTPARLLGIDGRVGSLEAGKDADIVIFKKDPLSLEAKPVMVFAAGQRIDCSTQ